MPDIYRPVDVTKRKPKNQGWYNLTSDSFPEAVGRAWFDGKLFDVKLTKQYAGFKLFWLEKEWDRGYNGNAEGQGCD